MHFSSFRRFAIGYVLLVGLPLLGLLGGLRLGRNIAAPIPVDGVWNVTAAMRGTDECMQRLQHDLTLIIAQSGKYLLISTSFDPSNRVDGELIGEQLMAASLHLNFDNNDNRKCRNSTFSLSAKLNASRPLAMTGELTADGCSMCRPLRFTAAKQSLDAGRR